MSLIVFYALLLIIVALLGKVVCEAIRKPIEERNMIHVMSAIVLMVAIVIRGFEVKLATWAMFVSWGAFAVFIIFHRPVPGWADSANKWLIRALQRVLP